MSRSTLLARVGTACFFAGALSAAASLARAQANVNQAATTVQLPTFGVAIDAEGVLSVKVFTDPTGELAAGRLAAAKARLDADVAAKSDMRKVSLVRLETAVRERVAAGEEPDEVMRHLAGLQRVDFVFVYPDRGDIVLAGPAEGWMDDAAGRAVGITTGRPVVLLEDLIVALRAYPPGGRERPFVGCTIDPDADALVRLMEFQKTIPRAIPVALRGEAAVRIAQGVRDSLGLAHVRVFGVSDQTHLAQVLIEADYRMKLMAVGLEPPPVKMATFISAVEGVRDSTLQRWWFTPHYDCVKLSEDRLAMELVGQGVQLQGEDKVIGPDGKLLDSDAKPSRAGRAFTTNFTRKYPEIADKSPVYAQMRSVINLLIAAAFLRTEDAHGRVGWEPGIFADESALPVETLPNPEHAQCVANSVWKGTRLFTPAGGGVSIQADEALLPERLLVDKGGKLGFLREQLSNEVPDDRWWWD